MIDTDKYEGHTPAPWVLRGNAQLMIGNSYMTEADGLLLRDAPLLLEEVKRLRDELKQAHHFLRDIRDGWLVDRDWIYINEYLGDEEE